VIAQQTIKGGSLLRLQAIFSFLQRHSTFEAGVEALNRCLIYSPWCKSVVRR